MRGLLWRALQAVARRVLGISAEEVRYTFDDVRAELRATRAELKDELAALRRDVERLGARPPRGGGSGGGGAKPKPEA